MAPRKTSLQDRLEYALFRAVGGLVTAAPERVAERAAAALAGLAGGPLGVRRETVERNLRIAFPEAADEWVRETAVATYRHLGREAAAILRLSKVPPGEVVERTITPGFDELMETLGEGKGALLVTGHYGNWEIAAAAVAARGVPISAIVRRQRNRLFDVRLDAVRRRLGVETIDQRSAPKEVPRLLRAGGVVGIVADQDARRAGIFVPFFGRPASTARGPALFALRLGAPVFVAVARRLPGEEVRYELASERLQIPATGVLEDDLHTLTAAIAAHLEREIRVAPEQYFWFHRRWKTRPKPEPRGSEEGMRREG